ncbi:hypothetical protein TKK_0005467 [Trichogramma kaykai]|uniref:Prefoldin subunit 4 n=1 Tax=Trichogramma kaykai TaxID=54128 RepID=A0ABD2XII9_9HYME
MASRTEIKSDSDVHISFEDQQKINRFARLNAKLEDYKDELRLAQNDLQNINDAVSEIELFDDDVQIPYHLGEVFVHENLDQTQVYLEDAKKEKESDIKDLESKCKALETLMSDLKTQLYAKFGKANINLENEEE